MSGPAAPPLALERSADATEGKDALHSVSWNLTQRCNLRCRHCYLGACPEAPASGELSTEECRRVMDEIARLNPNVVLILSGGEPLLRGDLLPLAALGREKGFTVVVGSNGVLLRERQARLLREHGVQGVGLSLDSTDPARHDAFRGLRGGWAAVIRATEALRGEGLDFSVHMSVMDWNVDEIPAMIDLVAGLGARALNFFFLVRTGCAERLRDLPAARCEEALTYLARVQGAGAGGAARARGLLLRAKCAPHFRRIVWELDPRSPLLRGYAGGSCPAAKHYCRITPEGGVTPCPYMPVSVGSLRARAFDDLWRSAAVFRELREGRPKGRCGDCEFRQVCGGCRCRAYASSGDYLGEDPACGYQPGGGAAMPVTLPPEQTFGLDVDFSLPWEEAARSRLQAIPSFARGMVVRAVEAWARSKGRVVVTPDLMTEVRQQWGARFRERG